MTLQQIVRLLQYADSALPVGAFAFSNSLETAVEQGVVYDAATLREFVETLLRQSASTDGIAALAARRATLAGDYEALLTIDARLIRCKLNDEARQMNRRMGRKLAELGIQIADVPLLVRWRDDIVANRTAGTYPTTQGIVFALGGLDAQALFAAQQYGVMMTTLNAALRCLRLTHFDTQRIIARLAPLIEELYDQVRELDTDDMYTFAPVIDLLAALHERGTARMFMN